MSVRFTKICHNDCNFCIEKNGKGFLKPIEVEDLAKIAIDQNPDEMLILGGEPFLMPKRLLKFLDVTRYKIPKIYATTSITKAFIEDIDSVYQCIRHLDCLNISIHSMDNDVNNRILNSRDQLNRIGLLSDLVRVFPHKIRVNLYLNAYGISTKQDLELSILKLRDLGISNIKICELCDANGVRCHVSFCKIMGVNMPSEYSYGCHSIYEIAGVKVVLYCFSAA